MIVVGSVPQEIATTACIVRIAAYTQIVTPDARLPHKMTSSLLHQLILLSSFLPRKKKHITFEVRTEGPS